MSGRYTLATQPDIVARYFGVDEPADLAPRFNIAPGDDIATIRRRDGGPARMLAFVRWGLIPSWSRDPSIGERLINARAETVAEKPGFNDAFRHRRCLVPADGFYEWRSEGGRRQPYLFRLESRGVFAFAGLWSVWTSPDGEAVETCAIVTIAAGAAVASYHDRMPVILRPDAYETWLDTLRPGAEDLLRPYDAAPLEVVRVSTRVNDVRNDDATLLEPAPTAPAPDRRAGAEPDATEPDLF